MNESFKSDLKQPLIDDHDEEISRLTKDISFIKKSEDGQFNRFTTTPLFIPEEQRLYL